MARQYPEILELMSAEPKTLDDLCEAVSDMMQLAIERGYPDSGDVETIPLKIGKVTLIREGHADGFAFYVTVGQASNG